MNLMEQNFQSKEEIKRKRTTRIILVAIIIVFIIIVSIVSYLMYIKSTTMKLTIDGQANEKLKNLLVFEEDGTIYVPIKEIAPYFGYDSFNGEYTEKSEEQSKCFIQSQNEIANFELGQNKIYKLDLTKRNADYEYEYIKKPVKAINGVLYVSTEGLEKAFNVSFTYEKEKNSISIFTLPYLYKYYSSVILDYGYTALDSNLVNQKAILKNRLIVVKDQKQYGVIMTDGTIILEPKYDSITYLANTGDFLVGNNNKVGIISDNRETKVKIIYDSIELMDSDAGLYMAKRDNQYGVIDIRGNIKIYIENEQIGIDISKFSQNNIKSKYILVGNLIPVKKNRAWALYDTSGNQLTDYEYDSLGYIASNNKEALNLLTIPNYNVIVACKDKKYTLINSSGIQLFATIAEDIYMTISGGETHYYIAINDQRIDAEEWLDVNGITARPNTTKENKNSSSDERNPQETNEEEQQSNENNNSDTNNSYQENNDHENNEQEQDEQENQEENNQE